MKTYYALPLDERRHQASAVRRSHVVLELDRGNGRRRSCLPARLDDDELAAQGEATLDALHERMRDEDGLLFHFIDPGGTPQVRGLLTDQAAYLRALLDAHEFGGEPRFLHRARMLASSYRANASAPKTADFTIMRPSNKRLGNLTIRDRPLADNSLSGRVLPSLGRSRVSRAIAPGRARACACTRTRTIGPASSRAVCSRVATIP